MFNVGDRVRVYKTNWGPKKPFIGHEYIISEIRSGKDTATTYILSRLADCDSPTGACCYVWYDSELAKIENDVKNTKELFAMFNRTYSVGRSVPLIKNVIFNDPATIVFWSDGSKTVVKCQDDDWYDPEKGLVMAISKKALGNKGNYCNEIKKWLPKEEPIDWYEITKAAHAINDGLVMGISAPSPTELINKCRELANKIRAKKKESAVQRAYDALVNYRDGGIGVDVDELIGYLGQALEE